MLNCADFSVWANCLVLCVWVLLVCSVTVSSCGLCLIFGSFVVWSLRISGVVVWVMYFPFI